MGWWSRLDLTAGQRPHLKSHEKEHLVQHNVGLYEGKLKAPLFQDGRVYLTSLRLCYVDSKAPATRSLELALADIDSVEYYGGFMRSSPKITIKVKSFSHGDFVNRIGIAGGSESLAIGGSSTKSTTVAATPSTPTYAEIRQQQAKQQRTRRRRKLPLHEVTWICPICFFSNQLSRDFEWSSENGSSEFPVDLEHVHDPDGTTGMPPCETCGITASRKTIFKAIEQVLGPSFAAEVQSTPTSGSYSTPVSSRRNTVSSVQNGAPDLMMMLDDDDNTYTSDTLTPTSNSSTVNLDTSDKPNPNDGFACPRCTFINHPSLNFCEICGARLVSPHLPPQLNRVMVQDAETLRSANKFEGSKGISKLARSRIKEGNDSPSKSGSGASTPTKPSNTLLYDDDGYLISLLGVSSPSDSFATAQSSVVESVSPSYKLSFRAGGDKQFYETLKEALQKVKQQTAVNGSGSEAASSNNSSYNLSVSNNGSLLSKVYSNSSSSLPDDGTNTPRSDISFRPLAVGIHGIQLSDENKRQHNRQVLGGGLEDLAELMIRAKDLVKLAEDYAKYLAQSDTSGLSEQARQSLAYSTQALGLSSVAVTKELAASDDSKLYYGELARQLAEFLTDNKQWHASISDIDSGVTSNQAATNSKTGSTSYTSVLDREGGIITLFDLYAVYNRARGVSLISPQDLYKSCSLLDELQLPITLRKFRSGLLAVQESYKTPEVISRNIIRWMKTLGEEYRKKQVQNYKEELFIKGLDVEAVENEEALSKMKQDILDFEGTGVTAMDVSNKFKWSVQIATEELELCEERGELCRDEQVVGTIFYQNLFLEIQEWNWKKEVFGESN